MAMAMARTTTATVPYLLCNYCYRGLTTERAKVTLRVGWSEVQDHRRPNIVSMVWRVQPWTSPLVTDSQPSSECSSTLLGQCRGVTANPCKLSPRVLDGGYQAAKFDIGTSALIWVRRYLYPPSPARAAATAR